MAAGEIRVGDEGTKFLLTINEDGNSVDISNATTKEIEFVKPSETTVTQTATFETDGTDGKIYYTTTTGDLDEEGLWALQGYIVTPSGKWHTDIRGFQVHDNL